ITDRPLRSLPVDLSNHDVKVAVLWANFGLYHLARLSALNGITDLSAIEFASFQTRYGWKPQREALASLISTLSQGPYEDQKRARLSIKVWRLLSRIKPKVVLVPGYSEPPALTAAVWCLTHRVAAVLMSES